MERAVTAGMLPARTSLVDRIHRHPTIGVGGGILLGVALLAAAAPLIAPFDPQAIAPFERLMGPGAQHWFGTDLIGRDVFSRSVHGARVSITVGLSVTLLSITIGVMIGLVSGFVKLADAVVMRVMDGMMAIPSILLAVALIALTGASLKNIILAITIAEVPRVARLVRSVVLSLRERPFVDAAIVVGTPLPLIMWRHILPNTLAPLLVQASHIFAAAVLTEAVLSFIGAGVPPGVPSWGSIIAEGRSVFRIAPHIVLFPSAMLSLTVLAVNLLGDGLRDAADPKFLARR